MKVLKNLWKFKWPNRIDPLDSLRIPYSIVLNYFYFIPEFLIGIPLSLFRYHKIFFRLPILRYIYISINGK